MGETIDLSDLNNIEENFENVKLFGGGKFKKGVRDLRPGAFVIYKDNRKWEVVKFDDKDARFLFIRREGEEDKRVYNGDIVMYREPPESSEEEEFSPKVLSQKQDFLMEMRYYIKMVLSIYLKDTWRKCRSI